VATGLSQHSPPLFPSAANARRAAPAPPVGVRRPATAPARPQEAPLQCRVRRSYTIRQGSVSLQSARPPRGKKRTCSLDCFQRVRCCDEKRVVLSEEA
jgi:hypothetical protein